MAWRRKPRNDNSFVMKTPVLICMGLYVTIGPSIAIAENLGFNWLGIVSASLLCVFCGSIPLALRELAHFVDGGYEAYRPASNPADPTNRLNSSGLGDDHSGNPHCCSRCGNVCDHRWGAR